MTTKYQLAHWILTEFGVTPDTSYRFSGAPTYNIDTGRGNISIVLFHSTYRVTLPGHEPTLYPYTRFNVVANLFRANKWTRFYCYAQANFTRDEIDYYIEELVNYFGEASPDFMYPTMDSIMADLELFSK